MATGEWPEGRVAQGDAALYRAYLAAGVPEHQCVYVKDGACTRTNCQRALDSFLKRSAPSPQPPPGPPRVRKNAEAEAARAPATLVFYYGGHGTATGFATIGGTWTYRQVAKTIAEEFHGRRVLFLLDCCAAGNLWRHLPAAAPTQYALLAASQPHVSASAEGDEWVFTNTWLSAAAAVADDPLSLADTISLLADRHLALGDLFFAYVTPATLARDNPAAIDGTWSWFPSGRRRSPPTPAPSRTIPREARLSPFRACRVGDAVAYKHQGGQPPARESSLPSNATLAERPPSYVPPLWLHGIVVAIRDERGDQRRVATYSDDCGDGRIQLLIRVWYPSHPEPWEVEVPCDSPRLIDHYFVAPTCMIPRAFRKTQVLLARRHRQYLDCSVASGTPVRAIAPVGEDGHGSVPEGTVVDWREFQWQRLLQACTGDSPATTTYDEYYWHELSGPVKAAASALGYTKSSWDDDTGIPADGMDQGDLTSAQREAAAVLGYIPPTSRTAPSASATVAHDSALPDELESWKNAAVISMRAGPHVPVEWDHGKHSSLVPLAQLVLVTPERSGVARTTTSTSAAGAPSGPLSPTRALDDEVRSLLRGLEASGKVLGNAASLFGTADLSAFWPDDGEWYDARPINIEDERDGCSDREKSALDLVATHFRYVLPGVYCPIKYKDGVRHLVPVSYIYRRGCQPQQEERDSDGESNPEGSAETATVPTEECINDMVESLRDISSRASLFGTHFAEAARRVEEAAVALRASFEASGADWSDITDTPPENATASVSVLAAAIPRMPKGPYFTLYWRELPEHVKSAARRVGYNERKWDGDGLVPLDSKEWQNLTRREKQDLVMMGYDQHTWGAKGEANGSDSDNSDSDNDY